MELSKGEISAGVQAFKERLEHYLTLTEFLKEVEKEPTDLDKEQLLTWMRQIVRRAEKVSDHYSRDSHEGFSFELNALFDELEEFENKLKSMGLHKSCYANASHRKPWYKFLGLRS